MELKFRYTFKRKNDGKFYQISLDIEILEQAHGQVFDMLANDLWELHAKDLYLGIQDKNGVDLCCNDICKKGREIGIILWDDGAARYIVDRRYSCNKGVRLDYIDFDDGWLKESEQIGDIYNTPELLGKSLAIKQ